MNEAKVNFLFLAAVNALLITLLLFVALPSFFVPEERLWQPGKLNSSQLPQCGAEEKESCLDSSGCPGYRICRNGAWSECIIKRICTPGDTTGCFANSCDTGYAVCNRCGTAYENCTPS